MTQPAADPHAPRLAATLEHWKSQLLDLTKRNRALNFRVQKVSTVTIVDEQPAEVYRQLVGKGTAMRFVPLREPGIGNREPGRAGPHDARDDTPETRFPVPDDEELDPSLSNDFAP